MPFGPGTYPPGDPRNEGVDPMMGVAMAPPMDPSMMGGGIGGMGGLGAMDATQNPLIQALLTLLMQSQGQGGGMIPGMIPGATPPGMEMAGSATMPASPATPPASPLAPGASPLATGASPLLDLLRGQGVGGGY